MCPVIGACDFVLYADGYCFISDGSGPLRITTYGAEDSYVTQS
jgi:hypothetical protein